MTAEKAALLELHTTPEELAARTQRMDAIAAESKKSGVAYNANYDGPPIISGEKWEPIPPPKPTRAKPIKGLCTFCGKHYSKHHILDDKAYCTAGTGSCAVFTLERKQADPPAQAGGLTAEDVSRIKDFVQSIADARDNVSKACGHLDDLQYQFDLFLKEKQRA